MFDILDKTSCLFSPQTSFRFIPKDKVEKEGFQVHMFVREEDKKKVYEFLKLCEDTDEFYTWDYSPGPLAGGGGVCIFRNNRPIYAYSLWIS